MCPNKSAVEGDLSQVHRWLGDVKKEQRFEDAGLKDWSEGSYKSRNDGSHTYTCVPSNPAPLLWSEGLFYHGDPTSICSDHPSAVPQSLTPWSGLRIPSPSDPLSAHPHTHTQPTSTHSISLTHSLLHPLSDAPTRLGCFTHLWLLTSVIQRKGSFLNSIYFWPCQFLVGDLSLMHVGLSGSTWGLVPWPGIEPASPAPGGGFLTTGPSGKFWSIRIIAAVM